MTPPASQGPAKTLLARFHSLGWEGYMLAAVPLAILGSIFHWHPVLQFVVAGAGIIPLAGMMGRATEELAHKLGPGIGGLLNATFGNAAELILAFFLLRDGKDVMVKASLTGSIIGNLLLVMGASFLAGGMKFRVQTFSKAAVGALSSLMMLAVVGLLVPAMFHWSHPKGVRPDLEHTLSLGVSGLLILAYGLSLYFSLVTHKDVFRAGAEEPAEEEHGPKVSLKRPLILLLVATALVALMSEFLVHAIEPTSELLGLTEVFMGVIVVALVGNVAEHSTAILVALKNQAELSVGIAIGSALQVALFVAPVLVFASYLPGREQPLDLLFTPMEVVSVVLAVFVAKMVAEDGESNWLEGVMLLVVYAILAVAFGCLPNEHGGENPSPAPQPVPAVHG